MVRKVSDENQSQQYPALIELTSRTIEVYDQNIFEDLVTAVMYYEDVIIKELNLEGENVQVTIRKCWPD